MSFHKDSMVPSKRVPALSAKAWNTTSSVAPESPFVDLVEEKVKNDGATTRNRSGMIFAGNMTRIFMVIVLFACFVTCDTDEIQNSSIIYYYYPIRALLIAYYASYIVMSFRQDSRGLKEGEIPMAARTIHVVLAFLFFVIWLGMIVSLTISETMDGTPRRHANETYLPTIKRYFVGFLLGYILFMSVARKFEVDGEKISKKAEPFWVENGLDDPSYRKRKLDRALVNWGILY